MPLTLEGAPIARMLPPVMVVAPKPVVAVKVSVVAEGMDVTIQVPSRPAKPPVPVTPESVMLSPIWMPVAVVVAIVVAPVPLT